MQSHDENAARYLSPGRNLEVPTLARQRVKFFLDTFSFKKKYHTAVRRRAEIWEFPRWSVSELSSFWILFLSRKSIHSEKEGPL